MSYTEGAKRARSSWSSMIQRCTNPKAISYPGYGARGVSVCDRWRTSFLAFLADMGERPEGTSLDRINSAGHYEPGNCRWATPVEQSQNPTNAKMGRPRRAAKVADELIAIRLTKAERRAWDAAAKRAEQSLSEWLRTIANREAGK